MMPILFQFEPGTSWAWLMYVLWAALVTYATWTGWRGAAGPFNAKKGEYDPPRREDRMKRAGIFGGLIAILGGVGLQYSLPASAFPGGKGMGIPIHLYGIMLAGGFMGAVALAAAIAQHEWPGEEGPKKREQILDLAFWVFLAAMVGSRVLFVIVNWKDFSLAKVVSNPVENLLGGGLVFQGGLVGGVLASLWYCRREGINFLRLADLAVPTISFGAAMGRLGCFAAGCCWGDVAGPGAPFAVKFPGASLAKNLFGQFSHTASLAFQSQSGNHQWVSETTGQVFDQPVAGAVQISQWVAAHGTTLPVHPTQLYESLGQLALFLTFLTLRGWRRFHGQLFGFWLMAYGLVRGGVELFRGDAERGTLHGLLQDLHLDGLAATVTQDAWFNVSTGQAGALALFALGVVVLFRSSRSAAVPGAVAAAAA